MAAAFPTAGTVLTAAEYNKLPRGVVGYAEDTTSRGPFTTAADYTNLSITFTGVAGRLYRAVAYIPEVNQNASAGVTRFYITDGAAAELNRATQYAGISEPFHIRCEVLFEVTGSYTVKVRADTSAGNMTTTSGASTVSSLIIEDVGAA